MNQLTTQNQTIEENRLNQLAAVGRALSRRDSHPLLKYTKGEFWIGEREIALGTRVIAAAGQARAECHNFRSGHSLAVPIEQSFKLPKRDELGDTDPAKWDRTLDGEPRDPWTYRFAIDLLFEEEIYTLATSSYGGQKAVGALIEDFACAPEARAGRLPIIALESDAYSHKIYGRIKVPRLPIVDWSGVTTSELFPAPRIALPRRAAEIIDDEIPF